MCTEEYIRKAVEMLDAQLFEGDLKSSVSDQLG